MRLRTIIASLILASILATGCGAANAAPTQQAEPAAEAAEPTTTAETAAEPAQTAETAAEPATTQQAAEPAQTEVEQPAADQVLVITYPDGLTLELTRTEDGVLVKTSDGDEFPMTGNMPWNELPFGQTISVDDLKEPFLGAFENFLH